MAKISSCRCWEAPSSRNIASWKEQYRGWVPNSGKISLWYSPLFWAMLQWYPLHTSPALTRYARHQILLMSRATRQDPSSLKPKDASIRLAGGRETFPIALSGKGVDFVQPLTVRSKGVAFCPLQELATDHSERALIRLRALERTIAKGNARGGLAIVHVYIQVQ